MIVLTVLSYNGAPSDGPSTSFDEIGGTIGDYQNASMKTSASVLLAAIWKSIDKRAWIGM